MVLEEGEDREVVVLRGAEAVDEDEGLRFGGGRAGGVGVGVVELVGLGGC